MEEILKQINSDILTESVVAELKQAFETAVNEKVEEFKKQELVSETEKILDTYDAKFEEFKTELNESKEKEVEEYKESLVEALDGYLEIVVEEFLKENKIAIETEIEAEKSKAIVEAFETILVTAGVDVARIVEAKKEAEVEDEINEGKQVEELEARFNKVLDENKALRAKNDEMLKLGLKSELSEGLSMVQKDKFMKLAEIVEMDSDKAKYLKKLEAIRESVMGEESKTVEAPVTESTTVITESKTEIKSDFKVDSSRFF